MGRPCRQAEAGAEGEGPAMNTDEPVPEDRTSDVRRIAAAAERQTSQLQEIRDHLGCLLAIAWIFLAANILAAAAAALVWWQLFSA